LAGTFIGVVGTPALAVSIQTNGEGDVTGVTALQVGTHLYDIVFLPPASNYNEAYGDPPVAVFYSNATSLASAIAVVLNNLAPNVPDIAGTFPAVGFSGFVVPVSASDTTVALAMVAHHDGDGTDDYNTSIGIETDVLRTGNVIRDYVFAYVASTSDLPVSETPLPGALPLFATGLGALGLIVRRRGCKLSSDDASLVRLT